MANYNQTTLELTSPMTIQMFRALQKNGWILAGGNSDKSKNIYNYIYFIPVFNRKTA